VLYAEKRDSKCVSPNIWQFLKSNKTAGCHIYGDQSSRVERSQGKQRRSEFETVRNIYSKNKWDRRKKEEGALQNGTQRVER
jgi:hypothetical protein